MILTKKKLVLGYTSIVYFGLVVASNNFDESQNSLAPFFPIENSYTNVLLCSFKQNVLLELSENNEDLSPLTKKVLTDSQKITYGFCLRGIVNNDKQYPVLAIITSQPGIALNFEVYSPLEAKKTTRRSSINMDPASKQGILLKKISKDDTNFWFTRKYRTNIDGKFINASCSFFGPFFESTQTACCFFYTSLPNYQNNSSLKKNDFVKDYPPFTIFYYKLLKTGYSYYEPCYIAYTPSKNILLRGYKDRYFTLVLATFFPYHQTNEKKIFIAYDYTLNQLQKLKDYLNIIRNNQKTTYADIPDLFCFNQRLHELLIYFLHMTNGLSVNKDFYKEVNRKINYIIKHYQQSPEQYYS